MAQNIELKTTYEAAKVLKPIFTRGNVALSRNGRILATCLDDHVILSNLHTGEQLAQIEGDDEIITSLSMTPSASHIILCSRSLSMCIYTLNYDSHNDTLGLKLLRSLKPHQAPVVVSTIDDSGNLLATGGADGIVKVWDIKGGYIHTFHGHSGLISALHFFHVDVRPPKEAPRAKQTKKIETLVDEFAQTFRLASGGEDGKVRVWSLHKRKSMALLDSHVSVVRKIDYCPEENALLSTSRDKTVMVWDTKSWKNRHTIPVLEELETVGFLVGGNIIYCGGESGNLRLWSMDTGKELTKEQIPKSETEAIQDSICYPDLQFLVTIHADQTLTLHDISGLTEDSHKKPIDPLGIIRRICGNYDQVVDLAYIGADKTLLAVNSNSEDIRIITLLDSTPSGSSPGNFFGGEVALLKGHEDIIISMDVDWSGHWLATGSKDNNARLWRLDPTQNSFSCYALLTGHAEKVAAVALPHSSPPSSSPAYEHPLEHPPKFFVTGSDDRTIKHWLIPTPSAKKDKNQKARATYTRKAHEKDINALAVHSTLPLFASASQDRLVKIWSIEDGTTVGILRGHRRGVWTVAFSPQGIHLDTIAPSTSGKTGYVLTGSSDNTVRLWSLADYTCILTLDGHANSVLKVIWLPPPSRSEVAAHERQCPLVASAAADQLVKIWDLAAGTCATTLDSHSDRVWALTARPPDSTPSTVGESLISGAADGTLAFWRDTTAATAAQARQDLAERIATDQRLSNLMQGQKWREAIMLALQLDQPGRLLAMFKSVGEGDDSSRDSYTGSVEVDAVIEDLADEQIYRLLLRCRDWNTNARSAIVAQRVLSAVVHSFSREKLAAIKPPRSIKGDVRGGRIQTIPEILDGLRVWTERHYERATDMWDESFLIEFVLGEMDGLTGLPNGHVGMNGRLKQTTEMDDGLRIQD